MNTTEPEYILSTNSIAMALYMESKQALMASDCYDFMVFRCYGLETILEDLMEWEESISIDEVTYLELHGNLCAKLRAHFNISKLNSSLLL